MKFLTRIFIGCVLALVCAANAGLGFVKGASRERVDNPILTGLNAGFYGIAESSDTSAMVTAFSMEVITEKLEASWYLELLNFGWTSEIEYAPNRKVMIGQVDTRIDPDVPVSFNLAYFYGYNWGMYCSDMVTEQWGHGTCDTNSWKIVKNSANPIDTMPAKVTLYWYPADHPRYDSVSGAPVVTDSTTLDCRLQYVRGPDSHFFTAAMKSRASRSSRGIHRQPNGWKVPLDGRWTLRNLQGREIPLRQEPTNDGVLLLPSQGLHGVGVLTGPNGQASKVHSLGGN